MEHHEPEPPKSQLPSNLPDGGAPLALKCPACGCVENFYQAATQGEATIGPKGEAKLSAFQMPYQTVLGPKMLSVLVEVCPACFTVYARAVVKQRVMQPIGQSLTRN